jgi:tRNA dimethylallyltransferase
MKKVIVIVGPTASGKTKLSIQLATYFQKEIINGDSVQVYKGLDIGSAKITKDEMSGIKHHLLSIIEPTKLYSVFDFQKDVRKLLNELDMPIIVGGTGLYIKAALSKYDFIERKRDETFELKYKHFSNDELYELLIKIDPEVIVEKNNRRRVLRAYEQALNGEPRSKKNDKDLLLYDPLVIYLDLNKEELNQRLTIRLAKQIEDGFIEEVKDLKQKNMNVNAIGYRELNDYLGEKISLEQAKIDIIQASKRLAKKQKTFFKNQMNPIFLDALSSTLFEDCKKLIINHLERK